jgi:hypothetical protein
MAMQGCAGDFGKLDQDDTKGGADGKAEGWGSADDPGLFSNDLNYALADMPLEAEATNVPWAGSYWPVYEDSINKKWSSAPSPAALYGEAFGVTGVEDAVSSAYGIDNNSNRTACTTDTDCDSTMAEKCAIREGETDGRCIPSWWGICHAWAPVAILEPEPENEVVHNGVTFKVNDIKALMTLAYNRTETRFVSLRCNENDSKDEIEYDGYDRPTGSDSECRDTNPGTWHVLLANYLGLKGESFVYDRTFDYQVWNQPVRGYKTKKMEEVTARQANELIGVQPTGGVNRDADGTVAKDAWHHESAIAVSAGDQVSINMTGTGDADLYVRFGSQPTATDYDCRPYKNGSSEECTVTGGKVYVLSLRQRLGRDLQPRRPRRRLPGVRVGQRLRGHLRLRPRYGRRRLGSRCVPVQRESHEVLQRRLRGLLHLRVALVPRRQPGRHHRHLHAHRPLRVHPRD